MTMAVPSRRSGALVRLADELLAGDRMLARYGLLLLGLFPVALMLQFIDPRLLASGVAPWVKPAKFLLSLGLFALTTAWITGFVEPGYRDTPLLRANRRTIVAAATLELAYIVFQAALGQESHFNRGTPVHAALYALMGIGATVLVAAMLPIAVQLIRHPVATLRPSFRFALVAGLVLTFLLGGGLGLYMGAQTSHAVGTEAHALPLFGWNRTGGDLRVAHFLGIHSQQAIPLLGLSIRTLDDRNGWVLLIAGTFLYAALTLATFAQAISGLPILGL